MKVLVTGGTGQVGAALVRQLRELPSVEVAAPARAELDLADPLSISTYVRSAKPRWIVSCGAYTAVDAAETDVDAAFAANATAPKVLAEEADALGAALIHFSTEYVFNGAGERPWVETDTPAPLNVYGSSKLAGEQAIAAVAARTGLAAFVLRTSWVYSGGGKNFVRTMLRLLSTRTEPLRIVGDQHGAPTVAMDLATAALSIMQQGEARAGSAPLSAALQDTAGVYHCAAMGETTWAGLAEAVREYLCLREDREVGEIIAIPTSAYPTPAQRPLNSRLNCSKLHAALGIRLPHWQQSLAAVLQELAAVDLQPLAQLQAN